MRSPRLHPHSILTPHHSLSKRLQGELGPSDETDSPVPELVGSGRPSPTDLLWSVKRDSAAVRPFLSTLAA